MGYEHRSVLPDSFVLSIFLGATINTKQELTSLKSILTIFRNYPFHGHVTRALSTQPSSCYLPITQSPSISNPIDLLNSIPQEGVTTPPDFLAMDVT